MAGGTRGTMPHVPLATTTPGDSPDRGAQFLRGLRIGMPIFLGYVPVGAAFGIIATSIGFSIVQAVTCSATALAGAGQFIALSQLKAGEGLIGVLAATTVVNLRYVLFGATISPHLKDVRLPGQAALAFSLTDETFAVNINDRRQGRSTAWSMAGVGAISWTGWVLGTLLGAAATELVGDPSRWGVEFAMPAMFTALFIALAEDRRQVIVGLAAAAIALALPTMSSVGIHVSGAWFIIIASTCAATIGALLFKTDGGRR